MISHNLELIKKIMIQQHNIFFKHWHSQFYLILESHCHQVIELSKELFKQTWSILVTLQPTILTFYVSKQSSSVVKCMVPLIICHTFWEWLIRQLSQCFAQGGLAATCTLDLTTFLISEIIPAKKSINHLRTITSVCLIHNHLAS